MDADIPAHRDRPMVGPIGAGPGQRSPWTICRQAHEAPNGAAPMIWLSEPVIALRGMRRSRMSAVVTQPSGGLRHIVDGRGRGNHLRVMGPKGCGAAGQTIFMRPSPTALPASGHRAEAGTTMPERRWIGIRGHHRPWRPRPLQGCRVHSPGWRSAGPARKEALFQGRGRARTSRHSGPAAGQWHQCRRSMDEKDLAPSYN